jgi:hypothetical protein
MDRELTIKDKWEAEVRSLPLTKKVDFLREIRDKIMDKQSAINSLNEDLMRLNSDADYVKAAIKQQVGEI